MNNTMFRKAEPAYGGKKIFLILSAVLLLAAACGSQQVQQKSPSAQTPAATKDSSAQNAPTDQTQNQPEVFNTIKVILTGQSNSGEFGTATIFDVSGKANVILSLSGLPPSAVQPAHIHFGSCAQLGNVKYPLSNAAAGTSQTILPVSLAELIAQPFAINVHKSTGEIGVYVACGDSTNMVKSISTNH